MADSSAAEDGRKADVRVRVHVERCLQHNARIIAWEYEEAPAHVRAFVTGYFRDVIHELALNGYSVSVTTTFTDVSVLDWYT